MTLPLAVSVPHAGWRIPREADRYCILTQREVEEDGDVGAREIYAILEDEVARFTTTDIARAIIDLNRAVDDRRPDGVVKTHTCWNVPVYEPFPPEEIVEELLELYYHPYHARLSAFAKAPVKIGLDCHTMAAEGPPVGPDPGVIRPRVCLSNADGTCPQEWIEAMRDAFVGTFGEDVRVNDPFQGGYITRSHAKEMPWMQIELSRGSFMTNEEKGRAVSTALRAWCAAVGDDA